jgi:hypothetical protein
MRYPATNRDDQEATIPRIGDRVERRVAGVDQKGTVQYADQVQMLVKWDDGSSASLRVGRDRVRILPTRGDRRA